MNMNFIYDMVASTFGGRRIFAFIWFIWITGAIIAHYALIDRPGFELDSRSRFTMWICIAALVFQFLILGRHMISKKGRAFLFVRNRDLPSASEAAQLFIWVAPLIAIGAVVSPLYFR